MTEVDVYDAIRTLIEFIGEDPNRPGLADTPHRVVRSYKELFIGYQWREKEIEDMMTQFDEPCDEMVILKKVEFYSFCEHHLLPFMGKAWIAYIPHYGHPKNWNSTTDGIPPRVWRVVGVSKLARLLEIYSRRLQIQERICRQVTSAIEKYLEPRGAACVIEAKHMCMCARGVNKQESTLETSSLTGCFKDSESDARKEFLSSITRSI